MLYVLFTSFNEKESLSKFQVQTFSHQPRLRTHWNSRFEPSSQLVSSGFLWSTCEMEFLKREQVLWMLPWFGYVCCSNDFWNRLSSKSYFAVTTKFSILIFELTKSCVWITTSKWNDIFFFKFIFSTSLRNSLRIVLFTCWNFTISDN